MMKNSLIKDIPIGSKIMVQLTDQNGHVAYSKDFPSLHWVEALVIDRDNNNKSVLGFYKDKNRPGLCCSHSLSKEQQIKYPDIEFFMNIYDENINCQILSLPDKSSVNFLLVCLSIGTISQTLTSNKNSHKENEIQVRQC